MRWKRKVVLITLRPQMTSEKLVESFAVDPETPLLLGVLAVLSGLEEQAKELASVRDLKGDERAWQAGRIAQAAEAQELILNLVERGNRQKRGAC